MATTPFFSVLCVCFNEQAFVDDAIRSVLSQSEPSLELILVDDQSTDATWEKMQAAAAADPRVIAVRNPTKGKVAGFNHAVSLSQGQWIHLLGGDDMLVSTCLEECRQTIEEAGPGVSGVYHDYTIINKTTGDPMEEAIQGPWLAEASPAQAIDKKYGIGGGFLAIRGDLARTVIWPQPLTWKNEDVALAVILKILGQVRYVPKSLYLYRLAPSHTRYVPTLASHRSDLTHFCEGLRLFRQRSPSWDSLSAEARAEGEKHLRHADLINTPGWTLLQAWKSRLGLFRFAMALVSRCDESLYQALVVYYRRLRDLTVGFHVSKRG